MKLLLVITDLDGTLLDGDYSCAAAAPALNFLAEHDIPLILCSSKTRAEIEHYRRRLDNRHPFISENGGGIFIPKGYFPPRVFRHGPLGQEYGPYWLFRLGAPYTALRRTLNRLRRHGFAVTGFGDLTSAEIADLTGLAPEQAELARQRDFDEPFLFDGSADEARRLEEQVRRYHLQLTRGRLWHLLGASDKGRAVALLLDCYRAAGWEPLTIGLGDQRNDFPLLAQVDIPVLVRQPEGGYAPDCPVAGLHYSQSAGPAGWSEMLLQLLPPLLPAAANHPRSAGS